MLFCSASVPVGGNRETDINKWLVRMCALTRAKSVNTYSTNPELKSVQMQTTESTLANLRRNRVNIDSQVGCIIVDKAKKDILGLNSGVTCYKWTIRGSGLFSHRQDISMLNWKFTDAAVLSEPCHFPHGLYLSFLAPRSSLMLLIN